MANVGGRVKEEESSEEPTEFCYTPDEELGKPFKLSKEGMDKFLKLIEEDKENK